MSLVLPFKVPPAANSLSEYTAQKDLPCVESVVTQRSFWDVHRLESLVMRDHEVRIKHTRFLCY